MTLKEIKENIDTLDKLEILNLAAYTKHLSVRENPDYGNELDRLWDSISEGDNLKLDEFLKIDADLSSKNF